MQMAPERVRERLLRAASAMNAAGVQYAVAGGNAVAAWVATIDPGAVRNTQDVDVLIRRSDLESAKAALLSAGFVHRHVAGIDMFLDGQTASARDAVHIVFAREKVRPEYSSTAPDVTDSESRAEFRVLSLAALVTMKLTSFRRKDQVHLLDMLEVGLIDSAWKSHLPKELADKLQHLINTPDQ
jgi:hypothetical protein